MASNDPRGSPPPYEGGSGGQPVNVMGAAAAAAGAVQDVKATGKELAGAAAVAGTAGMMVAGPALAVVGAVGGAIFAATNKGEAGGIARATGRAASDAFEKARAFDKEHHMTDKVKEVAANAVKKAKELDAEHHIMQKAKEDTLTVMKKATELNEKHKITDKVTQGMLKGLDAINKALTTKGEGKKEEAAGRT